MTDSINTAVVCSCIEGVTSNGEKYLVVNDTCFFHGLKRVEGVHPFIAQDPVDPVPVAQQDENWDDVDRRQLIPSSVVCVEFDVTPRTVRNWIRAGKVTGHKIRNRWYLDKQSLIEFTHKRFNK